MSGHILDSACITMKAQVGYKYHLAEIASAVIFPEERWIVCTKQNCSPTLGVGRCWGFHYT